MKTRQSEYSFALAHSEIRAKPYVNIHKQWSTQKIFMGGSFSGIWWSFVFGVHFL